jgi:nucleoside-diphosphate-sugar epimerase/predicted dehydrogenase
MTKMTKSNSLRVALVGCGRISVFHIAALSSLPQVKIVAVCDLDEEAARARALKIGVEHYYSDMETMMREQGPDVAHILTPPRSHLKLAQIAAKYGAHMYIEKPMAASEAEALAILEAAQKSRVEVCPGHSRLFDPPFLEACERINAGEVGRIVSVRAEQGFTYEAAARSAQMPWSYIYDWGIVENLLPHPLSVACHFLEEPGEPQVVGFNLGRVRESAVEEIRAIIPAKNAVAEVSLSMLNTPEVNRLEVVGTRGRIVVDFNAMSVLSSRQSGLPSAVTRFTLNINAALQLTRSSLAVASGIATGKVKRYMGLRNLIAEFYSSLQKGAPPPVRGVDGLLNARLMDRIKSACQGAAKLRVEKAPAADGRPAPKFLITGASGFLGGRLAEVLSAGGVQARAATRLIARAEHLPNIEWVKCDLGNEDELRRALSGVETVFHCAALAGPPGSLEQYAEANVKGSIRLAKLAAEAGVKNLIYISSISVYGLPPSPYLDETAPYDKRAADRGLYTQTKLAAEEVMFEYAKNHPSPRIITLRPGTIYGPGSKPPIGRLTLPSSNSRPIVAGSRRVPMPLTYVDNLIDAMLAAARSESPTGSVYNVIDSSQCDQGEVARALRTVSGVRIRPMFIPYSLVWMMMLGIDLLSLLRHKKLGTARYRLKRTLADMRYPCVAARQELGWTPRVTLCEGLARAVGVAMDIPKKIEPVASLGVEPTMAGGGASAGMTMGAGAYRVTGGDQR